MEAIEDKDALLAVKEAAHIVGVHPSRIRRAIAAGELEALTLGGRRSYRIKRSALDEFLRPVRSA